MVEATREPTNTAPRNSVQVAIATACLIVRDREDTDVANLITTNTACSALDRVKTIRGTLTNWRHHWLRCCTRQGTRRRAQRRTDSRTEQVAACLRKETGETRKGQAAHRFRLAQEGAFKSLGEG